jgi:DNA-binding GntR family transcriptional regulator
MSDNGGKKFSTSQRVEQYVRNAIYEGRLMPRDRIIEDEIARELGCSRGPVREAVLRLERDGMVITTPRRGTFIRGVDDDEIEEVFAIRGKLEGLCARYMRERAAPEMEQELRKCLAAMKTACEHGDAEQQLRADMNLHHTIWAMSKKRQLYNALSSTMNPLFLMVARAFSARQYTPEKAYENHEKYVEMLLTTPVARVEYEVEKYFKKLYRRLYSKTLQPLRYGTIEGATDLPDVRISSHRRESVY